MLGGCCGVSGGAQPGACLSAKTLSPLLPYSLYPKSFPPPRPSLVLPGPLSLNLATLPHRHLLLLLFLLLPGHLPALETGLGLTTVVSTMAVRVTRSHNNFGVST
ncbi:hypothetical protein Pmani_029638 [Petrolisthes manimaculis]|uniref:Uncharacterized protein n=1 Tax=Petrolisthes manimaculis TaxID=1843537 RepID=A0AAE1TU92_9EUCA|nr:hypothetical protein Pmani_029638 [Petrolisthes manimaculis]